MGERLFGARVRRREDARLITGRGRYVADVAHPGLLHVAVQRSPHAHGGAGMAMETRAIAARWDSDPGQVTVWSTTQAPQILRRLLARYLGLPEHAVRVVTQDIGGGFGPKGIVYAEDILVPYLARALGRPVQFLETRREHLLAVTQERDQWHDAELGLTREGQIVAMRVAEAVGVDAFAAERERARAEGRAIGLGLALFVEDTGLGPYEGIRVRVDPTGRVFVFSGTSSQGQAHETTLAQIVADGLSVPLEQITVIPGDTAGIAYGVGTFASRVGVLGGTSAAHAAAEVRKKALAVAAGHLEAAPEDLTLDDGRITVRGTPGRGLALGEVAAIASAPRPGYALPGAMDPGLEATGYVHVLQSTYSNGDHAAVVEVDAETGTVRLLRYVAVDDCGTMINPLVVEGQIHGGIAHGIGNALLEEIVYDETGQLVTGTLMDYALPRATDVPRLEVHHVVTPSPLNPLGVKGAGEGGTLPAPAAIANAVADALRPLGVEVTEMPLTRERLWRRLRATRP